MTDKPNKETLQAIEAAEIAYGEVTRKPVNCDAMKAAITAYNQARWQPIESAPKDGTKILFCTKGGHIGKGIFRENLVLGGSKTGFLSLDGFYAEPTHWQPLPTPPSEV